MATLKRNSPHKSSRESELRLCSRLIHLSLIVTFIGYATVGFVPTWVLLTLFCIGTLMVLAGWVSPILFGYLAGTIGFDINQLSKMHGGEILLSTFVLGVTNCIADTGWGVAVVLVASGFLALLAAVFVWDYSYPDPPPV